jgi:hypothetical protein
MHNEPLNSNNYILYCAKNYDGRYCSSTQDFYDDLNRIKYIKKLITQYKLYGKLKERLILNHIITLNNVFGPEALVRILYYRMKEEFKYIKPFLVLLDILPRHIIKVNDEDIVETDLIEMDLKIIEALRGI